MAPQNKRAHHAGTKASVPAKKAKIQEPEEAADPLARQLAPILAALATSKHSGSTCEMLEVALPHCLADAPSQRHAFQTRILDLASSALKDLEEGERADLKAAEADAESLRSQAAVARSDFEAAQKIADAKKEQSDSQGVEVDKLDQEVKGVKLEVEGTMQKKSAAIARKENLVAEQEAFQRVMGDIWEPLKTSHASIQNWRKRDKFCADLMEKLRPIGVQPSLIAALQVALKMKMDQRTAFAQKAISFAEDAFEKHKTSVAERIVEAGSEEVAFEKAVAESEAKLAEAKGRHDKENKEYYELQNSWAELETKASEAKDSAAALDVDAQAASEEVDIFKSKLDAALGISASFATLLDPPPQQQEQQQQQPAEQEPEASLPCSGMEVEAEVVAAA